MELLNYLNSHSDWQKRLVEKPYCLEIKNKGEYWLFKYNMITSDFSREIVNESRGCIVRQDVDGQYKVVCYPFRKFHNFSEQYSQLSLIDWDTAVVLQKVDGSICKFWHDKGEWHISTNSAIDARDADCGDYTYYDLIQQAIDRAPTFWERLDINYTYIFELTSAQNKIVVSYDANPQLWYLGRRNIHTLEEDYVPFEVEGINAPQVFSLHSLEACLEKAHQMGSDEEGYVVRSENKVNGSYARIKIKGEQYLVLHKLRGNGPLTITKIISLWQEDCIDDFIAYFPEHIPLVDKIIHKIVMLCGKAELAYDSAKGFLDRKEFALRAKSYIKPIQGYLFARLDNKIDCAQTYFKQMKAKNLAELLNIENRG